MLPLPANLFFSQSGVANTHHDDRYAEVERAIKQVAHQLKQLNNVWKVSRREQPVWRA